MHQNRAPALSLSLSADAAFGAKAAKILFSSSSSISDPHRKKKNEAALCFQLSPLSSLSALLGGKEERILSSPSFYGQESCVVASFQILIYQLEALQQH